MGRKFGLAARAALCAAMALPLGACGSMVKTHALTEETASGLGVPYCLPSTLLKVTLEVTKSGGDHKVTLSAETENVPDTDPNAAYWLSLEHDVFASDSAEVEITKNGLLNKVVGSHDPKSREIIENAGKATTSVLKAVTTVAKFMKASGLGVADGGNNRAAFLDELVAMGKQVFVKRVSGVLASDGLIHEAVSSSGQPWSIVVKLDSVAPTGLIGTASAPEDGGAGGIRYRLALPYATKLELRRGATPEASTGGVLHVCDGSRTFVLPLDRGFLVKRGVTVVLDQGVLKSVKAERPSEVLAFLGLPLTLAESVVGVLDGVAGGGGGGGGSGSGDSGGGGGGGTGSSGTEGGTGGTE